jgi:hypothetical protein
MWQKCMEIVIETVISVTGMMMRGRGRGGPVMGRGGGDMARGGGSIGRGASRGAVGKGPSRMPSAAQLLLQKANSQLKGERVPIKPKEEDELAVSHSLSFFCIYLFFLIYLFCIIYFNILKTI